MQASNNCTNREAPIVLGKQSFHSLRIILTKTLRRPRLLRSERKNSEHNETSHNRRQGARSVRFDPLNNRAYQVLSLDDYSDQEISSCWYSLEEYEEIGRKCDKVIEKLNQGKQVNSRKYCVRGLERMTNLIQARIACNKNDAYDAVILEQEIQREQNDYDPERIAYLYRELVSRQCHIDAYELGLYDARVVEKYLDDVDMQFLPQTHLGSWQKSVKGCLSTVAPAHNSHGRPSMIIAASFCH